MVRLSIKIPNLFSLFFLKLFLYSRSGDCKDVAAMWEELALKEEDKKSTDIQFAKVDCTTESELCEYHDVSKYPT